MSDPWGDDPPRVTSPEELARAMAVFDEIQAGYDRDAKRHARSLAKVQRERISAWPAAVEPPKPRVNLRRIVDTPRDMR